MRKTGAENRIELSMRALNRSLVPERKQSGSLRDDSAPPAES
jgi:hypothetical protein